MSIFSHPHEGGDPLFLCCHVMDSRLRGNDRGIINGS